MPGATALLALPYPLNADPVHVPTDLQALATRLEAVGAGVGPFTTAARTALAGADRWVGRIIYNTDKAILERWDGATWAPLRPLLAFTTAQRNALAGADLWQGRVIYNSDLLQHEWYNGGAWYPVAGENLRYSSFALRPAPSSSTEGYLHLTTDAGAWFICLAGTWFPLGEIQPATTVNRDAWVAAGRWDGRVIYNIDTHKLEQWDAAGAVWRTVGGGGDSDQTILGVEIFT